MARSMGGTSPLNRGHASLHYGADMEPTVTVTAMGQALATPDQVAVLLAVEAKSDTVGGAVSAASDAVAALVMARNEERRLR